MPRGPAARKQPSSQHATLVTSTVHVAVDELTLRAGPGVDQPQRRVVPGVLAGVSEAIAAIESSPALVDLQQRDRFGELP